MKNLTFLFNKLSIILVVLLGLNLSFMLLKKTGTNEKIKANTILLYKNYELKQNYFMLNKKIINIEKQLDSIHNYDKYIYAQIFGLKYNIDTISVLKNYNTINIASSDPIINEINSQIENISKTISTKLSKVIKTFKTANVDKLNSYPNISPLSFEDTIKITSTIGWRIHPVYKIPLYHKGADIHASMNTDAYSTMDGYVEKTKHGRFGFGNYIKIKNDYGYEIVYAHLNKIYVVNGQLIKKGELIGKTGNSGLSTTPHLHYEIRENGKLKNPVDYVYLMEKTKNFLANK